MIVKIKLTSKNLNTPTYATKGSAGVDLSSSASINLKAGAIELIPTGIYLEIPFGYEGQVRSRSGLSYKNGVHVLNSPGTIDSDYRGEVKVILKNSSSEDFFIEEGMRIAQLVFSKYEHVNFENVESFDETERGSGGFGSTGN